MSEERRWTERELVEMTREEFWTWRSCWDVGAWRLLGVQRYQSWDAFRDVATGDYVLRYTTAETRR